MTTTPTTPRQLVPYDSVLMELPIGKTKLHQLINDGVLTRVHCGRRGFVTRDSLDRYISDLIEAAG